MWTADRLRKAFLSFFEERGHVIVSSSSLIPRKDPTLLFTSAGMVQFKPLWAGEVPLPYTRAASVQKCLRLSDIENVGKTIRHETFFEMLGNFSFGDYFKEEAITWAWEFITEVLKIDPSRLYVSVHPEDEESCRIWREKIGIKEERIYKFEDNFWGPAGGTGACGPDTEIYYDLGAEFGECGMGDEECDRYIELWNLVFPQYNQRKDGTREPLKNRGVDTGMGLERLCMIMQGKRSIFETDVFMPIIERIQELTEVKYAENPVPFRIIADHARAVSFAITDGAYPSNEGRGYVIRRLIRRALVRARELEIKGPFLYRLVGTVSEIMKQAYPEVEEAKERVAAIVKSEEERFLRTIEGGMALFVELVERARKENKSIIDGKDAFKLYDTYGFPLDLTVSLAREEGLSVDEEGFELAMEEQRRKAKESAKFYTEEKEEWNIITEGEQKFVGYDTLEIETEVLAWRGKDRVEIILKETPFYGEAGGQVGDTGVIEGEGFRMRVENTVVTGAGIACIGKPEGEIPQRVLARVDRKKRLSTARNHTATHLLHAALRKVLGEHVRQEGSLVAPDRLRFDFTHFKPLSPEEIEEIERIVNEKIYENIPVETLWMEFDEAIKAGAIALFDEKYGKEVRVVKIGDFSMELCGGTHVKNTGEIGIFKIKEEGGIASGVRRIEALTGLSVYEYLKEKEVLLSEILKKAGGKEKDIIQRIENMLERMKEFEKMNRSYEEELVRVLKEKIRGEKTGEVEVVWEKVKGSKQMLRMLADEIRKRGKTVGVLYRENAAIFLVAFVSDDLVNKIKAGTIAREIGRVLGGGGGGKDYLAEAGGRKSENLPAAKQKLFELCSNLT